MSRIYDEKCIFEVGENSSHPELQDAERIWLFGGYTFRTATELEKFFANEGLDPKMYWMEPYSQTTYAGKRKILIKVVPKGLARSQRGLKELEFENEKNFT